MKKKDKLISACWSSITNDDLDKMNKDERLKEIEWKKQGALEKQKKIISLIKKQKMVYVNNQKGCDKDSKWLEGAESTCDYLIQLIKEKGKVGDLVG